MSGSAEFAAACWCGGSGTRDLDGTYRICRACGTLLSPHAAFPERYQAVDDSEDGFYGADYWTERVPKEHGLPTLEERSRTDLSERGLIWLRWLAARRRPPARVLELGSAHGAFVYLLEQAGYQAEGLEMSPRIVAEARQRFGITVHHGPLEDAGLPARYGVIAAFDVLEHLADPMAALASVAAHLEDDGLLFLQTPCYRGEGDGWDMLLPEEHLYLFTESSAAELLRRAGLVHQEIGPGCFAYDMWIVASRRPLPPSADAESGWPPLVQALLDADADRQRLAEDRAAVDADRQAKGAVIARLQGEAAEIDADRQAKDAVIARLQDEVAAVDADRRSKDAVIARLEAEVAAIDADRRAKDAAIARLTEERAAIEARRSEERIAVDADRQAKDAVIARLSGERDAIDADRQAKDAVIARLSTELEAVRADQQARGEVIEKLDALNKAQDAELRRLRQTADTADTASPDTVARG